MQKKAPHSHVGEIMTSSQFPVGPKFWHKTFWTRHNEESLEERNAKSNSILERGGKFELTTKRLLIKNQQFAKNSRKFLKFQSASDA